jgi:hypothetical protein
MPSKSHSAQACGQTGSSILLNRDSVTGIGHQLRPIPCAGGKDAQAAFQWKELHVNIRQHRSVLFDTEMLTIVIRIESGGS